MAAIGCNLSLEITQSSDLPTPTATTPQQHPSCPRHTWRARRTSTWLASTLLLCLVAQNYAPGI